MMFLSVYNMFLYSNDIIDIRSIVKKLIILNTICFVLINMNIMGIRPITDDKNIFLNLVILFNIILVDSIMT